MAGTWDDWLAALKAAQKGPLLAPELPSAVRGMYWSTTIELPGDWTGAALAGTVRSSPDAASSLAAFSVSGPVIAGGTSTFTISLAAGTGSNSTGVLPADGDLNGEESFPFMLLLTPSGGTQELLVGGLLTVIGKA